MNQQYKCTVSFYQPLVCIMTLLYIGGLTFIIYYNVAFLIIIVPLSIYMYLGQGLLWAEWRYLKCLFTRTPIIELTEDYFIDYKANLRLKWIDIGDVVFSSSLKGGNYVYIKLKDVSAYYKQRNKPYDIWNRMIFGDVEGYGIHLSEIIGEDEEIFETIRKYNRMAVYKDTYVSFEERFNRPRE